MAAWRPVSRSPRRGAYPRYLGSCRRLGIRPPYTWLVATQAANIRSRERVGQVCAAGGDPLTLRLRLIDELRRVVGFDWYAFVLTDPQTTVGCAPLADVPAALLAQLPRLIRLKYLTPLNRWTTIGPSGVALLRRASGDDPSRSLVWSQLLAAHGIGDVASLVLRDRFGCWGFLDLWRRGPAARFSADEEDFLADIADPVAAALRRSQASTFHAHSPRPPRPGPVVLLLTRDLDVLAQTPPTDALLRVLIPPGHDPTPIPAGAYNVAAQLLAADAGVDTSPAWARVHVAEGLWLTLRAATIGDAETGVGSGIAVSVEESSPAERVDLFARCFALTTRERELLGHLVKGNDTKQIARAMFLSEHTVQDHLKSIFAKTSTHTRKTLLSRVLGM
jgi:DNA-binding CsgD family transcriptional regulator